MTPERVRGGGVPVRPGEKVLEKDGEVWPWAGRALWTVVSFERQQLLSPCSLAPPGKEVGASHVLVYGPRQRPSCWASAPPPHPDSAHTESTHTHTRTHIWHLGGRAQCWKPCQSGSHLPGAAGRQAEELGGGLGGRFWIHPEGVGLKPAAAGASDSPAAGLGGGVVVVDGGEMGCVNPFLPSRPQPALGSPAGGMGRVGKSSKEEAEVFEKHLLKTRVNGRKSQLSGQHRQSSLPWST